MVVPAAAFTVKVNVPFAKICSVTNGIRQR